MKNKSIDLTQGSITRALLLFALPLLGTSIIQQMYNTVDLMFVGNLLGQDASAAVGTCSWPINCLVGFFTGMGVGVGVLVSQAYGGKDFPRLKKSCIQLWDSLSLALPFCCSLAGCLPPPFCAL